MNLESANKTIAKVVSALEHTHDFEGELRVGIDLGTAYIVLVVIDEMDEPVAVEMEFAKVLKDGLVVDYIGACQIVKRLKQKLEERLNVELIKAAIAVPPGTGHQDSNTHKYVVESAGFEVTAIVDEPTAANAVIKLKDGVIVDVGGGTTGLSILKNGEVIYTADEATGGTHVTLVLSGHYHLTFDEAEALKKNTSRQREVVQAVRPVFEKMASIVKKHIEGYEIQEICLVGGTCLLPGVEQIFESATGIKTFKPKQPLLVTPLGIALFCEREERL
ncbi:ethanolamine utilization protein EutJ [Fusibacter sp. 3D3]|uniref:ethanolamine utilization protein EutJ n=1 Tax=Fusibacter sp. 3D3 TaxID=1048380 RepID=UPI000852B401|nr:ethanolamine utilization protein EutJ [Fusibacter sp. 3D3]GAU75886.1 ethanolamine utilization protein EutJ [Fusibacter sp. 3D3]